MLQKLLLIGVGGSGGRTVRYTWRELMRRLEAQGWTGGMPDAWQFLHIDCPQYPDVISEDVPVSMGDDDHYVGLGEYPLRYDYYDRKLISREGVLSGLAGWRPDTSERITDPYIGAGQRRAVGRAVMLSELDRVKEALDARVRELSTLKASEQLQAVERALGADGRYVPPSPGIAVVTTSLGGGAGSGAFLDLMDMLHSHALGGNDWLEQSLMSVLYCPDVFDSIPEDLRSGIEPNSLAALSELLNATSHEGGLPAVDQRMLALGTGGALVSGMRGARHTFFVGGKSGVGQLSPNEVYRSVGRALAAQFTDDEVQRQFTAYLSANVDGTPTAPAFPLADRGRTASFGHATVTLGRSLFATYATERLARRSLDRLLRGYLEGATETHADPERLIRNAVERARPGFFAASGLHELSDEHDQVLDALRDRGEIAAQLDEAINHVKKSVAGATEWSASDWRETLTSGFEAAGSKLSTEAEARLRERAGAWVTGIQGRILDATATYVGELGLDVTIQLLVDLNEQVLAAANELEGSHKRLGERAVQETMGFRSTFDRVAERLGLQSDAVRKAFGGQRKKLGLLTEAKVHLVASKLMREVSEDLLVELQASLRKARSDLGQSERADRYKDLVQQWSTRGVPSHLKAAPNEVLLDPQEQFPGRLDDLLSEIADGTGREAGESLAIHEIITGSWVDVRGDGTARPQQLIEVDASWVPANEYGNGSPTMPRRGAFTVELRPTGLKAAAEDWVQHRRGPVAGYVGETLAAWLDPKQPDASARASTFSDAMRRALDASAPLASMNADVHVLVHGDGPGVPTRIVSHVPISSDHEAAGEVLRALTDAGLAPARASAVLEPTSPAQEVAITSFVGKYVHPVVFDSLSARITSAWEKCQSPQARRAFWAFRRSRGLRSFVPLAGSKQEQLMRGWLVADRLGHVDILREAWSEGAPQVWTPRGRRSFPAHLLDGDDIAEHPLVPGALFESLPLALMAFRGGDDDELRAYLRLMELGGEDRHELSTPFAAWILRGEVQESEPGFDAAPVPPAELAGTGENEPRERADILSTGLRAYAEGYREALQAKKITAETALTVGPEWEIGELAIRAALDLVAGIDAAISLQSVLASETEGRGEAPRMR